MGFIFTQVSASVKKIFFRKKFLQHLVFLLKITNWLTMDSYLSFTREIHRSNHTWITVYYSIYYWKNVHISGPIQVQISIVEGSTVVGKYEIEQVSQEVSREALLLLVSRNVNNWFGFNHVSIWGCIYAHPREICHGEGKREKNVFQISFGFCTSH